MTGDYALWVHLKELKKNNWSYTHKTVYWYVLEALFKVYKVDPRPFYIGVPFPRAFMVDREALGDIALMWQRQYASCEQGADIGSFLSIPTGTD